MRIKKKVAKIEEGDLTPMIDMTFQLIAFFMVLINFSDDEQNKRIQLPESELAKPPTAPYETPMTLQLEKNGNVILRGQTVSMKEIKAKLVVERQFYEAKQVVPADVTVIIRSDKRTEVDRVQELIELCQEARFSTFALRAQTADQYSK